MSSMDLCVKLAKEEKVFAINKTQDGISPPTLVVQNESGDILCVAISPDTSRDGALRAASVLRAAYRPKFITVMYDALMSKFARKDDQNFNLSLEEIKKLADDQSVEKVECIIVNRVDDKGGFEIALIPYKVENKEVNWINPDEVLPDMKNDSPSDVQGHIPQSLKEIMTSPLLDEEPEFAELLECLEWSEEKARQIIRKSCVAFLKLKNFIIRDYTDSKDDNDNPKECAIIMLRKFTLAGVLPKESFESLEMIIEQNFEDEEKCNQKLVDLFKRNSYWLPDEFRDCIEEFVSSWMKLARN